MASRMLLALLWVLHWLPLSVQAFIGRGFGALLHALAGARRQIALRNVELCFPEMPANERALLVRHQSVAPDPGWMVVFLHAGVGRIKGLDRFDMGIGLNHRDQAHDAVFAGHFCLSGGMQILADCRWGKFPAR